MSVEARLELEALDAGAELARFISGRTEDGAVVSFTGLARKRGGDGNTVERLRLDWHPVMTERSLIELAEATAGRFGVSDVLAVHRAGEIAPGETIVFVAVASPHRRQAFQAADYLMDRLKTEAMFWKHERGSSSGRWIEPTEQDRADRARWSD
ncbi:molybdenum cofactor biosynthesis protein MoaE [Brevundimonas aveniformis]|uniref:molybdenum cofactor biosynthesis protein MoaE n=1 Tax=Brevundimonas aveniformis TaxID=370977 RepID=UPI0004269CE9|nr:molybdenum cofactor biosynthesis protein MoaE [Brevundimonas aveniformis]